LTIHENVMTKTSRSKYNRIKEVLESRGETQSWLAEKISRQFVTVNRYVNNAHQPSIETLFEIAKVLKVNPKDLINS
jgi:putative transcriptional regulator